MSLTVRFRLRKTRKTLDFQEETTPAYPIALVIYYYYSIAFISGYIVKQGQELSWYAPLKLVYMFANLAAYGSILLFARD